MHIRRIPNLTNKELLKLSDNLADAHHLSTFFDDRPLTQVFLSLLAVCNHVRVVRTLPPRHASHPVPGVARKRQPRRRRIPTRRKSSRLSAY